MKRRHAREVQIITRDNGFTVAGFYHNPEDLFLQPKVYADLEEIHTSLDAAMAAARAYLERPMEHEK